MPYHPLPGPPPHQLPNPLDPTVPPPMPFRPHYFQTPLIQTPHRDIHKSAVRTVPRKVIVRQVCTARATEGANRAVSGAVLCEWGAEVR